MAASEHSYQERAIDKLIAELLPSLPAILLDGPKAIGKTTTALQWSKSNFRLDLDDQRIPVEASPEIILSGRKPILVDEWQKVPQTWTVIKHLVDSDYSGGQFLLTGSMPDASMHSGAGRIVSIRMRPLSFAERNLQTPSIKFSELLAGTADIQGTSNINLQQYCEEILQSGFPAIRNLSGAAHRASLNGYIDRIIDADMKSAGHNVRRPASLRNWLRSYAAATGTTASWETIRDAASSGSSETPSKSAAIPYRDVLARLRILDSLPPWIPSHNLLSQASQSEKHYLADPALVMRIMDLDTTNHGPMLGRLFEALAVLSIRTYATTSHSESFHFRDVRGRKEIDLIIKRPDGKILAVEIKLGDSVHETDFKHLRWIKEQLGDSVIDLVVINTGKFAYRKDGIAVIPLSLLGL